MSSYHYLFIRPALPSRDVVADISAAIGTRLRRLESEFFEYGGKCGRVILELEMDNDYEEDFGIPLDRYQSVLNVRDPLGDLGLQEEVAVQIMHSLAEFDRYWLALTRDMQALVEAAAPSSSPNFDKWPPVMK
ncbi:hypothetical protein [Kitasatospora purpeofusca]|uniref:hypothetical protein n=1 Tax=Kitasatospora purpeofusca TaxID=67352 RepID=UPI002A5A6667|nr:hypothetical protein [Kitasatospora purpeofusca]MDY0810581.1 hypothetical protein [Kitasatospora purpeofusca]